MTNVNKAFSVEEGIIVDELNGGPFYTGGTASPIGQGLPSNTVYTQTVAGGILLWQKYGAGDTASDWRNYPAAGLSYEQLSQAYRSSSNTVKSALDELRLLKLYVPTDTATTLNGTLSLTNISNTFNVISGSATGYSVQLPDATTINHGSSYIIANKSSESIDIKDGSGALLLTLNPDDVVEAILEDDPSVAGSWITIITSGSATGITSYVVTSGTLFQTTSSLDTIITGFSVTPVSGRYSVFYSADISISANNKIAKCVAYSDGVANENTRRETQGVSSNFSSSQQFIGEITGNGAQSVDVRVSTTGGTLSVGQRSLVLIRLGGA